MNTFTLMNSLRNEAITKKRSKDTRGTSACFKQSLNERWGGIERYYIF